MKPLTIQEKRVLELVSHGLSTSEIAGSLDLSVNTVETHRRNLLVKMEARNSANLVRRAFQSQLLMAGPEENQISLFIKGVVLFALMFCINEVAYGQKAITGKVTDPEGKPIPGVSIQLKGTEQGTITDSEGKYRIESDKENPTLIFSFIGMRTYEAEAGLRSFLDVQLKEDVRELSEVVVSALGLEAQRDQVGTASTRISGESVAKSGEPTLINGMSGKSSGLIVNRNQGDPGSGSYIQIRGQSSIQNSIQPLIIVDGIPVYNTNSGTTPGGIAEQSRLNDINPNDIASVEVLKGASASAIWGSRAGNGVIVITTKKGRSKGNKVNIEYSGTYSFDQLLAKHPLQNKYGQGTMGRYKTDVALPGADYIFSYGDKIADRSGGSDSIRTDLGYFLTSDKREIYPIVENGGKRSREIYDPYDAVFSTGHFYDQTLSISGGDRDGSYFLSIGDLDQKGIIKNNSSYKRTTFRTNLERQMTDWFRFATNVSYSRMTQQGIIYGNTTQAVMFGLRTPPDFNNALGYEGTWIQPNDSPVINRQRAYRNQIGQNSGPGYDNPVWSMNNERTTSEVDRIIGSLQLDLEPVSWLTLTTRIGLDHYSERQVFSAPVGSAANPFGRLSLSTTRETQFNLDGFLKGQFKLATGINLKALVGINLNQRTTDALVGTQRNLTVTTNPPLSLDNAIQANDDAFNSYQQIRTAAGYATADLDIRDQVFVGFTGRLERSSVFTHTGNPLYFYPSVSVAWHPIKTFGLSGTGLTFLKVRSSYGMVSTVPGPYQTATYWNVASLGDGFVSLNSNAATYLGGYQQGQNQGNPGLVPETKKEWEVGVDLRIAKDRLSINATYFTNEVNNLIIPVTKPATSGFTSRTENAAELTNHGVEIDVAGDVVRTSNWIWNVYGNWSRIRNKVTWAGGNQVINVTDGSVVVGYPLGIHYGTDYEKSNGSYVLESTGFPRLAATASVVGDPNPDWRLAIGTRIAWKSLSLNILVEHSHGGQMQGGTRGALITFGTHKDTDREVTLSYAEANTYRNALDSTAISYGYKMNADSTFTVRGYLHDFGGGKVLVDEEWWKGNGGGFSSSILSPFIESAQWTKLREVSLTYTLNSPGFQRRTKLRSIDFTLAGRNLFLWTDFKGNDPETNLRGASNFRGRDYFNNPATRSFLFTIRISY